jgi:hypothetical protein
MEDDKTIEDLASCSSIAPAFSIAFGNSIALAIVTPSLITLGTSSWSITTFLPAANLYVFNNQ